jgi:hypothetical protein
MNQIRNIMEIVDVEMIRMSKINCKRIKKKCLFSRNLHSRLAGKEVKFFGDVALHVWMCLNECVKWCVSSTPLSLNICLVRRRRMKGEKFELNIYLIYKRR